MSTESTNHSSPNLRDIWAKLCELSASVATKENLENFVAATDERINSLSSRVGETENLNAQFESRIAALEDAAATAINNNELSKQQKLSYNVSIHGVPQSSKENVDTIIKSICALLKVNVEPNDITKSYRISASQNAPGIIVVHFSSFGKKLELMRAKKKRDKIIASDLKLKLSPGDSVIFINNHLTPFYAKLLQKCKQAVKEGCLKSCWLMSSGKCVKDGHDKVSVVKCEADLEKMLANVRAVEDASEPSPRMATSSEQSSSVADNQQKNCGGPIIQIRNRNKERFTPFPSANKSGKSNKRKLEDGPNRVAKQRNLTENTAPNETVDDPEIDLT